MCEVDGWHEVESRSESTEPVKHDIEQHLTFLEFNDDGQLLLGSSTLADRIFSGSIWLFSQLDLPLSDEKKAARHICTSPVACGAFIDSNHVIVADDMGFVTNFKLDVFEDDTTHFVPQHEKANHDSWITSMSVCAERKKVITGGADMRICIMDVETSSALTHFFPAHGDKISSVSASPNDSSVFTSCSMDRTALLWDSRLSRPAKAITKGGCGYTALAWKDSNHVAIGTEMGLVQIHDIRSSELLENLPLQKMPVRRLAFSKGGLLASSSDSTEVVLWRFNSGKMIYPETKHSLFVSDLAWHPQKENLYSCGLDGQVVDYSFS